MANFKRTRTSGELIEVTDDNTDSILKSASAMAREANSELEMNTKHMVAALDEFRLCVARSGAVLTDRVRVQEMLDMVPDILRNANNQTKSALKVREASEQERQLLQSARLSLEAKILESDNIAKKWKAEQARQPSPVLIRELNIRTRVPQRVPSTSPLPTLTKSSSFLTMVTDGLEKHGAHLIFAPKACIADPKADTILALISKVDISTPAWRSREGCLFCTFNRKGGAKICVDVGKDEMPPCSKCKITEGQRVNRLPCTFALNDDYLIVFGDSGLKMIEEVETERMEGLEMNKEASEVQGAVIDEGEGAAALELPLELPMELPIETGGENEKQTGDDMEN